MEHDRFSPFNSGVIFEGFNIAEESFQLETLKKLIGIQNFSTSLHSGLRRFMAEDVIWAIYENRSFSISLSELSARWESFFLGEFGMKKEDDAVEINTAQWFEVDYDRYYDLPLDKVKTGNPSSAVLKLSDSVEWGDNLRISRMRMYFGEFRFDSVLKTITPLPVSRYAPNCGNALFKVTRTPILGVESRIMLAFETAPIPSAG